MVLFSVLVFLEIILILLTNLFYSYRIDHNQDKLYKVEIARLEQELENHTLSEIKLSHYPHIIKISQFDSKRDITNSYVVKEINNNLYSIEYRAVDRSSELFIFNMSFLVLLLINFLVLIYIWQKILKPFNKMSDLTYQLAKGNLVKPLEAEKSRYLGKFLWGVNMLRESLEEAKLKELSLQKEKKMLVLSLTHDIKTPLSAIELYARALQTDLYLNAERKQEVLEGISNKVQEISGYVHEITLASKEDFINLEVVENEFYLSDLIEVIQEYYSYKMDLFLTNFIVESFDNCLLVGDFDRLVEVLQNVIENAIKYGDGKMIGISFSEEEGYKLITIKNSGSNLKEEEITSIFDSFYRGSNSRSIKGSGLGLYISKSLMRKMQGDIFAQKEKDNFCINLVIKKA